MDRFSDITSIRKIKLRILVENSVYKSKLMAEHGLSIYLNGILDDGKQFKILFDVGQLGTALINNIKNLKLDLKDLDGIIFSHGHYDHTGGLELFLKNYNDNVRIFCHPDIFKQKFTIRRNEKREIGFPFNKKEIESMGGRFIISQKPQTIIDNIYTTGEIKRETSFEKVPNRFHMLNENHMVHDNILDDLALIVQTKSGIIIITGCSHSGIINTIEHCLKISSHKKILGLFGGFHLIDSTYEKIKLTIENLKKYDIDLIGACHCTGIYALRSLINEYLDKFRVCSTGVELVFDFSDSKI
ncbi:MAG: MBL fold metallo-hydrolase [Candidatus Helarchaeota archaeon]